GVSEGLTCRLGDHTTADDAARYRSPDEVQAQWRKEPIARLRAYLVAQKAWSKVDEERLSAHCQEQVEAAVVRYLGTRARAAESMFDYLYAKLPDQLIAQRHELKGA